MGAVPSRKGLTMNRFIDERGNVYWFTCEDYGLWSAQDLDGHDVAFGRTPYDLAKSISRLNRVIYA